MRFSALYWTESAIDHLAASHNVSPDEVEEVLYGIEGEDPNFLAVRDAEFYVVYGRTGAGRLLTIVGETRPDRRYRPFAARAMMESERRRYLKRKGRLMAIKSKIKDDAQKLVDAEAVLAKDHSERIDVAQVAKKEPYPNAPTSIRLSTPLLDRLDSLAAEQDRTRGNLIQHILWEYVRSRSA